MRMLHRLLAAALLLAAVTAHAAQNGFQIGVIAHPVDDANLRRILNEADADNLAFVVAGGIKPADAPCSDEIYERRKRLFDSSKNGLFVSVAASDWSDCRYSNGRTAAIERLNRIRELFFTDEFSFGATRLPLLRESVTPRFRSYSENMRWEFGGILFATIHLPANNNRYLVAAGRNGEFEDRQIANHDWLRRLFTIAKLNKDNGIVLFSDGSPLLHPRLNGRHDGFAEIRHELVKLATPFRGKVLIVHNRMPATDGTRRAIDWHGKLGDLAISSGWMKLAITPADPALFKVTEGLPPKPDAAK